MNRAARRRALRQAGQHRAAGKSGRRSALRAVPKQEPTYAALEAAGFTIAQVSLDPRTQIRGG